MNVWNVDAATFAEHWSSLADPARQAIADALELGPGVRVLDVGCGSGDFCAQALARGARVSGIDAAPAMVEIASTRAPQADLCVGPMERLPWDDDTFDAVTGFNSLQFTEDPAAALREWARVVRPGGAVAICAWAPREQCEVDAVESVLRDLAGAPQPTAPFCERLTPLVETAGLELTAHDSVAVPFEAPDEERMVLAMLFDARAYGVPEHAAREAIVTAAEPFRRRDGSYRFENAFRYVTARRP
jgi:SAM-dependent methyltransferase